MSTAAKNMYDCIGDPSTIMGDYSETMLLSIDQLSVHYFIRDNDLVKYYGHYTLHGVDTAEVLATQLDLIFQKDALLQRSYKEVKVVWATPYTILPNEFYQATDYPTTVHCQEIKAINARIIFETPITVDHILALHFSTTSPLHRCGVLLEGVAGQSKDVCRLYVNIIGNQIDVIYLDLSEQLQLLNTFSYHAPQDFIYFLLLVSDECNIDREQVRLILLGEISIDSQLYDLSVRYFRYVSLATSSKAIGFAEAFEGFPMHYLYHLYTA
jgi:hypothetical protein